MLNWTPSDGDTVHINPRNPWNLAAGRYRLEADGRANGCWYLHGVTVAGWLHVGAAALRLQEQANILTPVSAGELERERQCMDLRLLSPMRRAVRQHDASGLDLFRAANEPRLI